MSEDYSDSHTEEAKVSKYNSALAQLYRMDDLWKDSHKHSREIFYGRWNEDLDRMWMELISDSTDEQKGKMKEVNQKLGTLFIYNSTSKLKIKQPELFARLINLQKQVLMEKEEIIRTIQNKQGKGTAYQDDMDEYMD